MQVKVLASKPPKQSQRTSKARRFCEVCCYSSNGVNSQKLVECGCLKKKIQGLFPESARFQTGVTKLESSSEGKHSAWLAAYAFITGEPEPLTASRRSQLCLHKVFMDKELLCRHTESKFKRKEKNGA